MPIGIVLFLAWMALEVVVVVGSIVWGFETGQWKDIEEPKYRMLLDIEPQPWPGREKSSAQKTDNTDTEQNKKAGDVCQ